MSQILAPHFFALLAIATPVKSEQVRSLPPSLRDAPRTASLKRKYKRGNKEATHLIKWEPC
ncbi:MAG: hypothetical protein ACYTXY_43650 [Nostoc sp.]